MFRTAATEFGSSICQCRWLIQEINKGCRQLIRDHLHWCAQVTEEPHPLPCIHGDITNIMPRGSFDPSACFKTKMKQIEQAKLCRSQFCFTHNKSCPIFGRLAAESDLDVSGLPCPDMSRAGIGLKEEGPTSPVFGSHAKMHIEKKTRMIVLENVPDWFAKKTLWFQYFNGSDPEPTQWYFFSILGK